MLPQAHMPLCAHVHTHIYTCMPVMHPCTGSGRNQLCEHNRETDGAEHGHGPTGLIYREVSCGEQFQVLVGSSLRGKEGGESGWKG